MKPIDHGTFTFRDDDLFISDPHFGHANVIKYCNRPFCCKHSMDNMLIRNWNDTVKKPGRRIFCLGDFGFGSANYLKRILSQLVGYKILVKGNHDRGRLSMVECGFNEAYLTAGGDWGDKKIFLSHIPLRDVAATVDLHICGHVHQHWCKAAGNIINVGVDVWDLKPQTLKHVVANADRVQAAMAVQKSFDEGWEERNGLLVQKMYSHIAKV